MLLFLRDATMMLLIEVALRMIECEYYFIGGKEKKRKTGAIYI